MVFAAGLGSRLRPLTDRLPKALVEVGGEPALGRVLRRLAAAGAGRIVVNAHPFADRIEAYLREVSPSLRGGSRGPGPLLLLSREPERPLETGGGLLRAAPLFQADRPILLHNVDVLTDLDLGELLEAHVRSGALATLAVHERASTRRLLFDERGLLGREDEPLREVSGALRTLAFSGVQVVSPGLLARLHALAPGLSGAPATRGRADLETGARPGGAPEGEPNAPAFSIMDAYLALAARGEPIMGHDVTGAAWFEIGTPERLEEARRAAASGAI